LLSNYEVALSFDVSQGAANSTTGTVNGSGIFGLSGAIDRANPTASAKAISFSFDGEITGKQPTMNSDYKVHALITGGALYAKTEPQDWTGLKLDDVLAVLMAPNNPNMVTLGDPVIQKSIPAIVADPNIVKVERLADTQTLEDQMQIQFVYTVDVQALLASKDFLALVKEGMKSNPQYAAMTDDQFAAMMSMSNKAVTQASIKVIRWIGSDDQMNHALGADISVTIDPSAVTGITSGPGSEKLVANLHAMIKFTKIGQDVSVEAPAGVKVQTIAEIFNRITQGLTAEATQTAVATPAK
jgi:hypothetical protein